MSTIFYRPFNNIRTTVVGNHTASDPQITIKDGSGITISGGRFIRLTVVRQSDNAIVIYRATSITYNVGNDDYTLDVIPIEGTFDLDFVENDRVELRITAETLEDIHTAINTIENTIAVNAGPQGAPGPQGSTGSPGPVGPQGIVGLSGPQGTRGFQGFTGNNGPQGFQGFQGQLGAPSSIPGPQGTQGRQGVTGVGVQGLQGNQGNQGYQGIPGTPGGPQGEAGIGVQGPQGIIGPQGAQGAQGTSIQGPQGNQGDASTIPGPQGEQGTAIQGPQGDQGDASTIPGPQGVQGSQGFQGDQGNQGDQGDASTIPGPQGDQGDQGDQGPQGDQGTQGDASTIPGPQGNQGTQGFQGDQGTQGTQGFQGDQGSDSIVPGPQGTQGNQGFQGSTGATGTQGTQGNQGFQGESIQGPQGESASLPVDGSDIVNGQLIDFSNGVPDGIWIGGASNGGAQGIAIGPQSNTYAGIGSVSIGRQAYSNQSSIALGQAYSENYAIGIGLKGGPFDEDVYSGSQSIAIGIGAGNINRGVSIGTASYAGSDSIAIGYDSFAQTSSIALGAYATSGENECHIGGSPDGDDLYAVEDVYIGNGKVAATPASPIIHATGGDGTDIAGGNLVLAGGKSTGNATPGSIVIQTSTVETSGTTLQTLTTRLTVSSASANFAVPIIGESASAGDIPLSVKAHASQTSSLLEIQNSSGTLLSGFDKDGYGFILESTFVLGRGIDLATGTNVTGVGKVVPAPGKLWKWKALCGTNGASGGFTFDINKNGTTIFSADQTISSNTTTVVVGNTFAVDSVTEDDIITLDIETVGTGVRDVIITLFYLVRNN